MKPRNQVIRQIILAGWLIALTVPALCADTQPTANFPGFGKIIDPDGDCSFKVRNGHITLTIPGGIHDISSYNKKLNAPRILQDVEGDFTVTVKVSGDFEPGDAVRGSGTAPFNGAGLLVWDGERNYLRLERDVWVTSDGKLQSYAPLFEYWRNGKNRTARAGSSRPFYEGRATFLRIIRTGDEVQVAVSHDGIKWINVDSVAVQFPKTVKVGVAAINTSNKPFTVEFSDFKLTNK